MPMNLLMILDPMSMQSMNATISSEDCSLSTMKCDSGRVAMISKNFRLSFSNRVVAFW